MEKLAPVANLQLVYVSDIERSTIFYTSLFKADPVFTTPRYVAFSAGGSCLFAIWSGGAKPDLNAPRFSEIGIMLGNNDDVARLFNEWQQRIPDFKVLQKPQMEVFGMTFLISDPDGHIIRVSPLD